MRNKKALVLIAVFGLILLGLVLPAAQEEEKKDEGNILIRSSKLVPPEYALSFNKFDDLFIKGVFKFREDREVDLNKNHRIIINFILFAKNRFSKPIPLILIWVDENRRPVWIVRLEEITSDDKIFQEAERAVDFVLGIVKILDYDFKDNPNNK